MEIDDDAARRELEALVSDASPGPVSSSSSPSPPGKPQCIATVMGGVSLEPYHEAVFAALGTFLGLPPSMYGGLVPTTLQVVHSSRSHLLGVSHIISALDLSRAKQEALVTTLSTPYPLPADPGYQGFADSETLAAIGMPCLGQLVAAMEASLKKFALQLWERVGRAKLAALSVIAGETEAMREGIEEEYLTAQHLLALEKRRLNDCATEVLQSLDAFRDVAPQDFEAMAASLAAKPRPKVTEKVFAAAYIIVTPAASWSENPSWAEIEAAVLHPSQKACSYAMSVSPYTCKFDEPRHTLLFELMASISSAIIRSSGSAALETLHSWCLTWEAYIRQLSLMLPLQHCIETYPQSLNCWEKHNSRCARALRELREAVSEDQHEAEVGGTGGVPDAAAAAEGGEKPAALLNAEGQRARARQHIIDTIEGWGDYDAAAQVLTPDMVMQLFNTYDIDGSGQLSVSELAKMHTSLESFGVPLTDRRFSEFVASHSRDGCISRGAFSILMCRLVSR